MTIEEKTKFIEKCKKNKYLFISPRLIKSGAILVNNYNTLELYENMDKNTNMFAEKEIVNLISAANYNNDELKRCLSFNLIYCGDMKELPNQLGEFSDFIIENKDKIVAVHKYIKNTELREFFVGFNQTETVYNYGYLYLNFAKLLDELEKNNVKFEIDNTIDRFIPSAYRDDTITKFIISYNPKKEKDIKTKIKKRK